MGPITQTIGELKVESDFKLALNIRFFFFLIKIESSLGNIKYLLIDKF